jgi:hypothetical protein
MDAGDRAMHGAIAEGLVLLCQIMSTLVIPAGKRVSSAMDGKLKSIHGGWIPAIPAGMTICENSNHGI